MYKQPLIPRWAYKKGHRPHCLDYFLWFALDALHLEDMSYLELLHLKDKIDAERSKLAGEAEAEPVIDQLNERASEIAYWLDLQEAQ